VKAANWGCSKIACFGTAPLGRVANHPHHHHHDDGSVNIKVLIRNRTKGGDYLRSNLSLTNGIKNLIGFASLAVNWKGALKHVLRKATNA